MSYLLSVMLQSAFCIFCFCFLYTPRQVNIEPILPSVNPHVVPIPILKDGQLDLLVLVNPDTINKQTNSVPEFVILTYFPKRVNRLVDVTSRRTLKQISKWVNLVRNSKHFEFFFQRRKTPSFLLYLI